MTLQEVFNVVAVHLLNQGRPALNNDGDCQYRTFDPVKGEMLKCAVGRLIPDKSYHPDMEGEPVRAAHVRDAVSRIGVDDVMLKLLARLQRVHDDHETADWIYELEGVAEDFEISQAILFQRGSEAWNRTLQWSPDAIGKASPSGTAST